MDGVHPHGTAAGVVLAVASVVMLGLLSQRKRHIAGNIPSRALLADGWLSATGALLAAVTVAGTTLSAALGWWWADPTAAGVVAFGAVGIAAVMTRAESDAGLADQC